MNRRLPAHVEVGSILRRASATGDFATVVHKGDPDRGAILILVSSRGRHVAAFERVLDLASNDYRWERAGPSESAGSDEIGAFLAKRTQFDADLWAIELDIAEPERFIAETTSTG